MKECSELATIQTYKPFDVIYTANNKQINQVHIVLSGRLSIIQYLNINVCVFHFFFFLNLIPMYNILAFYDLFYTGNVQKWS